jgi:hypothetical protein
MRMSASSCRFSRACSSGHGSELPDTVAGRSVLEDVGDLLDRPVVRESVDRSRDRRGLSARRGGNISTRMSQPVPPTPMANAATNRAQPDHVDDDAECAAEEPRQRPRRRQPSDTLCTLRYFRHGGYEIRDTLAERASSRGQSLRAFLLELVSAAARRGRNARALLHT